MKNLFQPKFPSPGRGWAKGVGPEGPGVGEIQKRMQERSFYPGNPRYQIILFKFQRLGIKVKFLLVRRFRRIQRSFWMDNNLSLEKRRFCYIFSFEDEF